MVQENYAEKTLRKHLDQNGKILHYTTFLKLNRKMHTPATHKVKPPSERRKSHLFYGANE